MRQTPDEAELLAIDASTLFTLNESGRIVHENDPEHSDGPRLCIMRGSSGAIALIRHDVSIDVATRIEKLVADEPPFTDLEAGPVRIDSYLRLLEDDSPVTNQTHGVIYRFTDQLDLSSSVTLIDSGARDGDELLARLITQGMPESLIGLGFTSPSDLWAPWSVAVRKGEIVSIGMTARLGPHGAEAGVVTAPSMRGHGYASAVVAAWASHTALKGKTLFYSADIENTSSRRVAEKFGLSLVGASFRVT